jgi:hypothetical protein
MLWLVLVAASTWFGYQIIPFARLTNLGLLPRVFSGWLLGSIISGMVLYITTFIIPLSFMHTLLLTTVLIGGSAALLKRGPRGKSNSELTPWLLFYLLLTAGISLRYCASLYNRLPYNGPSSFAPIYDTEISFITSVISGCNRRHLLYYNNPLVAGEKFHGYALPLLFTAACMTFGASYSDASIIISFMNTVFLALAGENGLVLPEEHRNECSSPQNCVGADHVLNKIRFAFSSRHVGAGTPFDPHRSLQIRRTTYGSHWYLLFQTRAFTKFPAHFRTWSFNRTHWRPKFRGVLK